MRRSRWSRITAKFYLPVLLLSLGALVVPQVAAPQKAWADSSASDDFQRANGSLGPDWADMSGGGMAISGDAAVGTSGAGNSGDLWAAG
ncbi:MAG TPA: hypothetical protein VG142_15040, partial [Trebonia sp.]|nr:hypothetical protein [Trebonia sp.]